MDVDPRLAEEANSTLLRTCPDRSLRITGLETYFGANPHAPGPTLVCTIEIAPIDLPAAELHARLARRLGDAIGDPLEIPGDTEDPAGAVASLAAGAAGGLLSTHFCIAHRAGSESLAPDRALFWVEFPTLRLGMLAACAALCAIAEALRGETAVSTAVDPQIRLIQSLSEALRPVQQSQFLIATARKHGIPFLRIRGGNSLWQFGWGSRSLAFTENGSNGDGLTAHQISWFKPIAKYLFHDLGIPTPAFAVVRRSQDARKAADQLGWPRAVKPVNRGRGEGVSADIADPEQFDRAVALARQFSSDILVEEHEPGLDHRLMVIDGRMVAAVRREPASIVGDGMRSVGALLEAINAARRGRPRDVGYLTTVDADAALHTHLAGEGLTLDSVLPAGRRLALRSNANRSTGGAAVDVTASVHPQVRHMAEQLARAVGFRCVGIDYITPDISREPSDAGGGVIEINATPGATVLLAAGLDEEEIGALILGDRPGRIPATLLLVPEAILDEVSGAAEQFATLARSGHAAVCGETAWIGDYVIRRAGQSRIDLVTAVLRHPTVERLLLVWSMEEMVRVGLPLDRFDVGIVAGPAPDEPWLSCLKRTCTDLHLADDLERALPLALGASAPAPLHQACVRQARPERKEEQSAA